MKTLNDLILLIAVITVNNEGKLLNYLISLDLRHNWLSLWEFAETYTSENGVEVITDEKVLCSLKTDTIENIQQAYWTLYNACGERSNPSFQEI
jgi:hypothetical protein